MHKEYERGIAPRVRQQLAEIYRRTDAFAIVSGEYNQGIPPGRQNLLDHFLEEYFFRPSDRAENAPAQAMYFSAKVR
jgi:NAD(P)H-dependent FMN reductase